MQISFIWPDTPEKLEKARAHFQRFNDFSARYRDDASLRARIDGGDTADALAELGIDLPSDDVRARIVADTPGTMHFVLPPDPNIELADETLGGITGGKSISCLTSVGTAASFFCSSAPSSVGTASSMSTAGTGLGY